MLIWSDQSICILSDIDIIGHLLQRSPEGFLIYYTPGEFSFDSFIIGENCSLLLSHGYVGFYRNILILIRF